MLKIRCGKRLQTDFFPPIMKYRNKDFMFASDEFKLKLALITNGLLETQPSGVKAPR